MYLSGRWLDIEGIGWNEAGSICGKGGGEGGSVPFVLSLPNDPLAEASTIGISRAAQFQFRFSTGNRIDYGRGGEILFVILESSNRGIPFLNDRSPICRFTLLSRSQLPLVPNVKRNQT